jgi:hypothetical protein
MQLCLFLSCHNIKVVILNTMLKYYIVSFLTYHKNNSKICRVEWYKYCTFFLCGCETWSFKLREEHTMFVFLVFRKCGLCCSSSENLTEWKISRSCVEQCKFCIHLRSLNVCHFGMVASAVLKWLHQDDLQYHDLLTEFHKNYQLVQKLIVGTECTKRMMITLAYIFL